MHGPSLLARLEDVDHPRFPEHLGIAEASRFSDAQLMPSTEEPSDPFQHMPADSIIRLAVKPKLKYSAHPDRDQERSLRMLEESGENSPGATNLMAQQSVLNLLQQYQSQKAQLELEKARLEAGM